MPWTPEDAQRYTSAADTPEKQRMWAEIANRALFSCMSDGGKHDECAARAIRIANAAVAEKKALSYFDVRIKGFQEREGIVWGYANVAVVDRGNPPDLIEPEAWPAAIADFLKRPLLLLMHEPINAGEILALTITKRGLWIKAKVKKEVFQLVLDGKLTGFSIGWLPVPGGYEFKHVQGKLVRVVKKLFLFEISLVDRPMNQESLIEGVEQKMIKDEQININREAGEIVVSGLTSEQMSEFMTMLDMIIGNTKAIKELPSPVSIVFKRDVSTPRPEPGPLEALFAKLLHAHTKDQEDSMDKQIDTRLQAFDDRLKKLEDSFAKLPDTVKASLMPSLEETIKKSISEAAQRHTTAQNDDEQKKDKTIGKEDQKAQNTKQRHERIAALLKELGVDDDKIQETIAELNKTNEAAQEPQPDDAVAAIKSALGLLSKRMENLETILGDISSGSVTRSARVRPERKNKDISGLPGAILAEL